MLFPVILKLRNKLAYYSIESRLSVLSLAERNIELSSSSAKNDPIFLLILIKILII